MNKSALQKARLKYSPEVPAKLKDFISLKPIKQAAISLHPEISQVFPHLKEGTEISFKSEGTNPSPNPLKVGIVLSGGPASGGHNVIAGVFDALQKYHRSSSLIGFLSGPSGIIDDKHLVLTKEIIDNFRNQGGFDLLGTGRTKIETPEQFEKCLSTVQKHNLDGLVIVGGDDSNTNAAFLAEYFLSKNCKTSVIGVPKTIDGDLKNQWIETSFGFDSAAKTYSGFIGNVCTDATSQGKYFFFIKVMGRTASHLVLECALKTKPNLAIISEEVDQLGFSLKQIVDSIADLVVERAAQGKYHGVILIPEGIIEFVPEMKKLFSELAKIEGVKNLSSETYALYQSLPEGIQKQLVLDRDPHGNINVSKIETERLLIALVENELTNRKFDKKKFSPQPLFCGYEGRSCLPSNFDASYCYSLGLLAALLIRFQLTGYMAVIRNLGNIKEGECLGVPLVQMIDFEERKGKKKAVIKKGLVDLKGKAFLQFKEERDKLRLQDDYLNPGPIQFFGPSELTDQVPFVF